MPFCVLGSGPRLVLSARPWDPEGGTELGACRSESRVTCPWAAFPSAHPGPHKETPTLPEPVSPGHQRSFTRALSPLCPFSLRTCTAAHVPPSQLLLPRALTLLVLLTWPRPTWPGALFCRPCDCLPGLPLR